VGTGAPQVGDLISANLLGFFPNFTPRDCHLDWHGGGQVLTLLNNATSHNRYRHDRNSANFNTSGAGIHHFRHERHRFSGARTTTTTAASNGGTAVQTFNIHELRNTIFPATCSSKDGAASIAKTGAGRRSERH
jgi:hypothetical protein